MRMVCALLAVALCGAAAAPESPGPAVGDKIAQLVGTWSCRDAYGLMSSLVYRADGTGYASTRALKDPSGRVETATLTYHHDPAGGWAIDVVGPYFGNNRASAPVWNADAWPVQFRNTTTWYAFGADGSLRRSSGETGPSTLREICIRGRTPPDPSICIAPELPTIVYRAVEPDTPAIAQQQGIVGTVHVTVSLDADSHVVGTKIASSPSVVLNRASESAARQSVYLTAHHNCKPVPSEYDFAVSFSNS
jgi:hypothetical protein